MNVRELKKALNRYDDNLPAFVRIQSEGAEGAPEIILEIASLEIEYESRRKLVMTLFPEE